ncbi:hypothetical protein EH223_08195 [candidate division KSB1 bacterium]|nr:hypothetical protein [candidate division KSB1 bacterium]RQW04173.1 MAG: hypothetical protein EH223_08195 [candidate division KSB1 bacterium]
MDNLTIDRVVRDLLDQHGAEASERINAGVRQVANFWQETDGSSADFVSFCTDYFIAETEQLQLTFVRFERNFEIVWGHAHEVGRDLSMPLQLEMNPVLPVDYLFAEYDPFAHLQDDMYANKIAFVVLLNFPIATLDEKLAEGATWSRSEWAKARLAETCATRVPAEVSQELAKVYVQADDYIANYNIVMHNLVNEKGDRLFPAGLKLITHWGLRDELKSHYARQNGVPHQQMIYEVMQDIITQDIPRVVINNETVEWNPMQNQVFRDGRKIDFEREPDVRYQKLLSVFKAERSLDAYSPNMPTKIDRRFQRDREIPELEFENLISAVLKAPVAKDVAQLIAQRLDRLLQPFDIWYDGFKGRSSIGESELDKIVSERYSTVQAFQDDLPRILSDLGFSAETAAFLESKITVDPSRGAGHASGAMRRTDNAHLRTRIPETGMTYKGYNIAIHELGHNVEQVFSLNKMDHYMLYGVPNTAFTEAFAFVFQSRDLDLLGRANKDPLAEHLKALDTFWSTCEIASVGLVDMRVWHWMYAHPEATAGELKEAVIKISKEVWNDYWMPILGVKDSIILGIYSHMIVYGLYLPDYSLGHIIMFQIEQYLKDKNLGDEMERMCRLGRITPDAWMRAAVGSPISTAPLIEAATKAIELLK